MLYYLINELFSLEFGRYRKRTDYLVQH